MAMTPLASSQQWRVMGRSVRGASHIRDQCPNQDAIAYWPHSGQGPPLILSVADGHGSSRHFRSHVGAKLAVQTASSVLQDLWRTHGRSTNLSAIKHLAEERLPQALVHSWADRVQAHLQCRPFRAEEWRTLTLRIGPDAQAGIEQNPLIAYGSTLIAVLLTDRFVLHVQLGDGDILAVSEAGDVSRPPLPGDERLLANQTTSLCSPAAWQDFRLHFQSLAGRAPALILLATDGYANSFADEAGFRAVGSDLLAELQQVGPSGVSHQLGGWLRATSAAGSGDDITMGLLWRPHGL